MQYPTLWVDGSLPRCDFEDREYYYQTMLTLFKSWRSGNDLRLEDETWDETFEAHSFTEHQLHLMDNFNIRYECADARDDYSTQSRAKSGSFISFVPQDKLFGETSGQAMPCYRSREGTQYSSIAATIEASEIGSLLCTGFQKLNRIPSCAEKGTPTVVPAPKKSPNAPPGMRRSLRLRMGRIALQSALRQISVTLPAATSLCGTLRAPISPTKLLPGF